MSQDRGCSLMNVAALSVNAVTLLAVMAAAMLAISQVGAVLGLRCKNRVVVFIAGNASHATSHLGRTRSELHNSCITPSRNQGRIAELRPP